MLDTEIAENLSARTVNAAGWATFETSAAQCISFLVFLVMARLLRPNDFGAVALANIYVGLSQLLIFQGLGQAVVQKAQLEKGDLEAAFWINIASGITVTAGTLLLCNPIAHWFHSAPLASLLRWLSVLFILSALADVQANLLARRFEFRALAVRTILSFALGGVVGIIMAWNGCGMWSLVGQQLTGAVLNVVLLWGTSDWRPRLKVSPPHARAMWRFSSRLAGHEFVSFISRRSDQFFVGRYLDTTAVGLYAVAARISTLVSEVLVRSLARVSLASLSRLHADPKRLNSGYYRILQAQACLTLPLAVALALHAREVVMVAVGSGWLPVVPVMQILLLAIPLEALSAMNTAVIVANGQPSRASVLTCYHAIVNVTLLMVVARWGLIFVASVYLFRAAMLFPIELFFVRSIVAISFQRLLRILFPPAAATIAMAAAYLLVRWVAPPGVNTLLVLFFGVASMFATYVATLLLLQRGLFTESLRLLAMLRSKASHAL